MNIYARYGNKVIFSNPQNGYQHHQEIAKKYLTVGNIYTVDHTEVGGWHTNVYLVEFPGVNFNSVLFEDISEKEMGVCLN